MKEIKQLFGQTWQKGMVGLLTAVLLLGAAAPVFAEDLTISGQITGSDDNQPIAEATVDVSFVFWSSSTTSDSSGNYSITVPAAATFKLRITPPAGSDYLPYDTIVNVNSPTTLNVALNPMPDRAVLKGKVMGEARGIEQPLVADALVELLTPGTNSVVASTTASVGHYEGMYQFTVPTGVFDMRVTPPNDQYQVWTSANVNIQQDATKDVSLAPVSRLLSGRVTTSDTNQPVSGVTIELTSHILATTHVVATAITDDQGNYSITPPTSYMGQSVDSTYRVQLVLPADTGYVWQEVDASVSVVNATTKNFTVIPEEATPTLNGRAIGSDDQGVPGVTVDLLQANTNTIVGSTTTDSSGNYSLAVDAGVYDVQFAQPGGGDYQTRLIHSLPLFASRTQDARLRLNQNVPPVVSGHIMGPNNQQIEGAVVEASVNAPSSDSVSATTNASGAYSLTLPVQTSYKLKITPPVGSLYAEKEVYFDASLYSIVDVTLGYSPQILNGSVTGPEDQIVSGARIDFLTPGTNTVNAATTTSTGPYGGSYSIMVEPGAYDVRVTPPAGSGYQTRILQNLTVPDPSPSIEQIELLPVDDTSPIVDYELSVQPNSEGWHSSPVTITWIVSDPESGISSQVGCDQTTLDTDATEITLTCIATSDGGTTNESVTIKYDSTAPEIDDPVWSDNPQIFGADTTLTAPVEDATSGVVQGEYFIGDDPGVGNGTAMTLANNELTATLGANLPVGEHSISIRAQDVAGKWSGATETTLTVEDPTPPAITYELSAQPGASGWYTSPVTLVWTVEDPESAITDQEGCETVTVDTDAAETSLICNATSAGGTSTDSVVIKYDATAPELGAYEWSTNPLPVGDDTTLTVPVVDPTSGVAEGEYFIGSDPGAGNGAPMDLVNGELTATLGANLPLGLHTVGVRAKDNAGNWSEVTSEQLEVRDVTPPIVSYVLSAQPSEDDWFKADVIIDWQATDPAPSSGTPTDPVDSTASTEGENVTYTSEQSCDPSNNCATGSTQLSIDKTLPTVSGLNAPGFKFSGQTAAISAAATDALSGVKTGEFYIDTDPGQGSGTPMTYDGTSAINGTLGTNIPSGFHTLHVRSQDKAGNWSTTVSRSFLVL